MDREEARERAQKLVSKMTLNEKMSQLRYNSPAIDRLGIPAYNWWGEALHGIARAGTATMFPQAVGMAAAFDEELMHEEGAVIADEGRAKYNAQSAFGDRDGSQDPHDPDAAHIHERNRKDAGGSIFPHRRAEGAKSGVPSDGHPEASEDLPARAARQL